MRGRKPLPTKLKAIRGNPGKRPLNRREPRANPEIPECPPHLDAEAKAEWKRMAKQLHGLGILAKIDRAVLAAYCACWSRWVQAEAKVIEFGLIMVSKTGGGMFQNPYLSVANRAMEQMSRIAAEFGMTPSGRARLDVEPAPPPADPFDNFLKGEA